MPWKFATFGFMKFDQNNHQTDNERDSQILSTLQIILHLVRHKLAK